MYDHTIIIIIIIITSDYYWYMYSPYSIVEYTNFVMIKSYTGIFFLDVQSHPCKVKTEPLYIKFNRSIYPFHKVITN